MRFDHSTQFLVELTEFMKSIKKHSINWNVTETYSHFQNREEDGIKQIKLRWKSNMLRTVCLTRLWYYNMNHNSKLISRIAPKDERPPL